VVLHINTTLTTTHAVMWQLCYRYFEELKISLISPTHNSHVPYNDEDGVKVHLVQPRSDNFWFPYNGRKVRSTHSMLLVWKNLHGQKQKLSLFKKIQDVCRTNLSSIVRKPEVVWPWLHKMNFDPIFIIVQFIWSEYVKKCSDCIGSNTDNI
jgi:hypothetical protein